MDARSAPNSDQLLQVPRAGGSAAGVHGRRGQDGHGGRHQQAQGGVPALPLPSHHRTGSPESVVSCVPPSLPALLASSTLLKRTL